MKRIPILILLITMFSMAGLFATAAENGAEQPVPDLFVYEQGNSDLLKEEGENFVTVAKVKILGNLGQKEAEPSESIFSLSVGGGTDDFIRRWWLDCMAPAQKGTETWFADALVSLVEKKNSVLSTGFAGGARLYGEGKSITAYDIPLSYRASIEPEAGAFSFPFTFDAGLFAGFSQSRRVSFGIHAGLSAGLALNIGDHFSFGINTGVDALMRLDVKNGYDSTFELVWTPVAVTTGLSF